MTELWTAISGLIASLGQEAIKTWGSLAIVVVLMGAMLWVTDRRSRAKDRRLEKLEAEITRLQEQRVEDAQRMILVAEHGTETMRARGASDVQMNKLLNALGSFLDVQRPLLPPPESR